MPHTIEEHENGNCQNMVSNLPLLFAAGYPTSLDKISEPQLEKFVPFMVQCSLGYIQISALSEYSEPEWWPEDLEFTIPFCKPKTFKANWLEKMRELVVICYSFHKCVFLLRFCTDLASYEPATLRFINNYNSTTSLFQRRTNKLLVTFRNENMLYDQEQQTTNRKCLLPKYSSSQQTNALQEQMVEPALFDIYLCDDCDAELYSYDAYVDHEKTCLKNNGVLDDSDDDVIFCGNEIDLNSKSEPADKNDANQQKMTSFLLNFNLFNNKSTTNMKNQMNSVSNSSCSNSNINCLDGSPEKLRRLPRRSRGTITLSKCTSIPLSSPCGKFLLKKIKTVMSEEYQMERLDRIERFCHAPPLVAEGNVITNRPKWMNKNKTPVNCNVSFKRPSDDPKEPYHEYKFPRRQLSNSSRTANFMFYNSLLLKRCKPLVIEIKRLTMHEVENQIIDLRLRNLNRMQDVIDKNSENNININNNNNSNSNNNNKFNINNNYNSNKSCHKKIKIKPQTVVECIDLCSSDDEADANKSANVEVNTNKIPLDNMERSSVIQIGMDIANNGGVNHINFNQQFDNCISNSPADSNFLLNIANNNNNHNALQPLRPSVYLFSNFKNATTLLAPNTTPNVFNDIHQTTSDTSFYLSNQENLTEIKENRVSDWLNDSPSVDIIQQAHVNATTTTLSTSTTSTLLSSTNNANNRRSMPTLVKLNRSPTSNSLSTDTMRPRTVITANVK